jgi:Ricin-type beta-trefoil lectin domain-like
MIDAAWDPSTARTPAEYVALLRQVRDRSGLSYRRIQRRAEAAGETLPASTLATMLGRSTLPREELVIALLRACGAAPDEIDRWVEARRDIASNTAVPPSNAATPPSNGTVPASNGTTPSSNGFTATSDSTESQTGTAGLHPSNIDVGAQVRAAHPRRRALFGTIVSAIVVLLVAGSGALVAALGHRGGRGPSAQSAPPVTSPPQAAVIPDPPAGGNYRIRATHSNRCLSERPYPTDDDHIYQTSCDRVVPAMSLDRVGGNYLIRTLHPEFGAGCMGVENADRQIGAVVADDYCAGADAVEFRLEPVGGPVPGFRLRPVHSGLCVGVVAGSTADWAPVRQLACDPAGKGQIFQLDPAPAPASPPAGQVETTPPAATTVPVVNSRPF